VSTDLFTPAGIARWMDRLNASPRFAEAAATWTGRLVLVEDTDTSAVQRRTWVHVGQGRCLEARQANSTDDSHADFVLAASRAAWDDLVSARTTPAAAAMLGRLKLVKGNALALIPHAGAAAEMLAAAAQGAV
jgi:putative sterol carrier protein